MLTTQGKKIQFHANFQNKLPEILTRPIKKTYSMKSVLKEWGSFMYNLKGTSQNTGS